MNEVTIKPYEVRVLWAGCFIYFIFFSVLSFSRITIPKSSSKTFKTRNEQTKECFSIISGTDNKRKRKVREKENHSGTRIIEDIKKKGTWFFFSEYQIYPRTADRTFCRTKKASYKLNRRRKSMRADFPLEKRDRRALRMSCAHK